MANSAIALPGAKCSSGETSPYPCPPELRRIPDPAVPTPRPCPWPLAALAAAGARPSSARRDQLGPVPQQPRLPSICAFALLLFAFSSWAQATPTIEIHSPDTLLTVRFALQNDPNAPAAPTYQVAYRNKPIIRDSRLGLALVPTPLQSGFEIVNLATSRHDNTWRPVYGERSVVRDRYRQIVVLLRETEPPRRLLELTLRAYNQGAAFRYALPEQPGLERIVLARELTEFRFTDDHPAWAVYSAQGNYERVPLSQLRPGCERPLTIQVAEDVWVALAEARLVDYARMKLAPLTGEPHSLISDLSSRVETALPLVTPWRVVMVADRPGRLLENNDLLLNLNDPCALPDTSWIKPGKVIREVTLTTVGGKACVDFAVQRNLQYVEFDAGWYGPENSDESDATTVTLDPSRSKGPLDLPEVIRYATERGIGIILYVNRRALERQLDQLLPLYRQWGVQGMKFGFVQVGSQAATRWLHHAIRNAAEHRLMVDVHDEYRPTGYSRTYPNLMTQEGIAGDETRPANSLTLTLLFTRMLAGAADNTICYYDGRVAQNATHAYQLAKAVCIYSPWQFLYWYDRPAGSPPRAGGAGGAETAIGTEPELEFFDHIPTVWDDTRVLHGKIGEFAIIARRHQAEWYLGCMNDAQARSLAVPLDFLPRRIPYVAHLYSHDPAVPTRTRVRIDRYRVGAETALQVVLPPRGGQAVRLVPAQPQDAYPRLPASPTGRNEASSFNQAPGESVIVASTGSGSGRDRPVVIDNLVP
ncbi:MAG: glycoside hydrolase family 97 protein [Verrucomicrobia bacterium]|nr:glycoside hydrolase family 97 protein [Verrucomicrobiota bacterium]